MKLSQMQYTRQDKDTLLASIASLDKAFSEASTFEQFMQVHAQYKAFASGVSTATNIAYIRFTLDTNDEFYNQEKDYYDEIMPEVGVQLAQLSMHYVNSPFRAELAKVLPAVLFTNLQIQADANNPAIVEDRIAVNKTVTEYVKLLSAIKFSYNGQSYTLPTISKFFGDPDREVRKGAYEAFGQAIADNGEQLDEIYDRLVTLRTAMGKKAGFDSFVPLGCLDMQRNCYTREDIASFRANVSKHLVPLATKLRNNIAKEQGWDKQYMYDNAVFTTEEPKPIGTVQEIFENGKAMYNEMSEHTGKLFTQMCDDECFDVIARDGKSGGGYCTEIRDYHTPFIFANFNGSQGDIDVLTHEFGHAFAASKCFDIDSDFLSTYCMETAEVHSMSMEFFAYPWIDKFFGDKTAEYKINHIGGALTFIPYGTIVDRFQEVCYENPTMTPAERNVAYNQLEKEFLPWASTEGIPALCEGRRWQRQSHIYEMPFYYIDYCLAQFTALQFLSWSLEDYDKAFAGYVDFVSKGGTRTFTQLIAESGLDSPFEESSFIKVVASIEKILDI